MTGWISLHRKVRDHWLFAEKRNFSKFEAWVDLLMEVNHQDKKFLLGNELMEVKRGQTITSIRKLCDRWGWSNTKVKQFFQLLETDGMATIKSDTKKTVITIEKYDFFQTLDILKTTQNTHGNVMKTTRKHTNNNDNNVNNENNLSSSSNRTPEQVWEELRLGFITHQLSQNINSWIKDGFAEEIIIRAMEITAEAGKNSWSYTNGILTNWYRNGCRTLAEVETWREKERIRREGIQNGNRGSDSTDSEYIGL
ncbi:DnaD domain protein [Gottfriedia acidiceleris]|uniref:DnaD domain-containing protein n=1 Tax=Gottfriedia acidiceleris TaxID=371036 RepID=UPI002FFF63AF